MGMVRWVGVELGCLRGLLQPQRFCDSLVCFAMFPAYTEHHSSGRRTGMAQSLPPFCSAMRRSMFSSSTCSSPSWMWASATGQMDPTPLTLLWDCSMGQELLLAIQELSEHFQKESDQFPHCLLAKQAMIGGRGAICPVSRGHIPHKWCSRAQRCC